jgi:hypothetical protein
MVCHCMLCPIGTAAGRFNRLDKDIPLDLVFFSPFEELRLRTAEIMVSKEIHWVYKPSPVPTLYVGRVGDLLWQIPLIPCFLDGNSIASCKRAKDCSKWYMYGICNEYTWYISDKYHEITLCYFDGDLCYVEQFFYEST